MKLVTMVQTNDGKLHDSRWEAEKHVKKLYSDLLLKLARDLTNQMKYVETAEYLDNHLLDFAKLTELKNDLKLETEEEND